MRRTFRCLVVFLGVMLASALAASQPDGSGGAGKPIDFHGVRDQGLSSSSSTTCPEA